MTKNPLSQSGATKQGIHPLSATITSFTCITEKYGLTPRQKVLVFPSQSTESDFAVIPADVDLKNAPNEMKLVPAWAVVMQSEYKDDARKEIKHGISL